MEKRTAESPMDFEWQTHAPGDVSSPFYQLSMHNNARKRPHSIFDSPQKNQTPSLREPNSQPFFFSQSSQRAPQPASPSKPLFRQEAFMTPRKFDLDFSSGAENMSSPEIAENEDTPEQQQTIRLPGHRNSLFGLYSRFALSSGRGEIPRLNHYSNALTHRVQKRRRRDRELDRRLRKEDDSDSDNEQLSSSERKAGATSRGQDGSHDSQQKGSTTRLSSFSEFFALLEAHPNVPSILSWWAQLVVNLALFSLAIYVVFGFVSAIRAEFDQAAEEVSDNIHAEIATCAKNYVDNRCAGNERLPALETVCENWRRCMDRDPAKVGRAKVSAHTMAVIINSFIDPISWKAILFFLATISTVTVASNWSFRSFRHRLQPHEYPTPAASFPRQPSAPHPCPPQFHHLQTTPALGHFAPPDQSSTATLPRQISNTVQGEGEDEHKPDQPLMIEDAHSMPYVTNRSSVRGGRLRTPSPAKRGRRLL